MRDSHDRDRQAQGLSELLDLASRTELIDELLIMVRTVPDDGAERDLWIAGHRRSSGPSLARQVNDDLRQRLTAASVRTEAFVTIVVPEPHRPPSQRSLAVPWTAAPECCTD